jgi:hypothetical protein
MHNASDCAKFLPKRVVTDLTGGYGSQQLTYELVATGKVTGVAKTTETATVIRYIWMAYIDWETTEVLNATSCFAQGEREVSVHLCKKGAAPWCTARKYYIWNTSGYIRAFCHMPLGVTSKTSCNRKYCTFTVTSTLPNIQLPTGVQGLFSHPVEGDFDRNYKLQI